MNLNWLLLGEGPELRGIDADVDVWTQLRQTLVAERVSHGAEPADAERMMPPADWLFHFLMVEMLEGWMRIKERQRPASKRGIALALERVIAGLEPFPIPAARRVRRRLI